MRTCNWKKLNLNKIVIFFSFFLVSCSSTNLQTNQNLSSYSSSINSITQIPKEIKIGDVRKEIENIDLYNSTSAFVHLSLLSKRDLRYRTEQFKAYYIDGFEIDIFIYEPQRELLAFDLAFYYARTLGWLPEILREKIKKVEISNNYGTSNRFTLNNEILKINLFYNDFIYTNGLDFFQLTQFLLEPYFFELNEEELNNYLKIKDESPVFFSESSKLSLLNDFIESYIYYMLIKNSNNKLKNQIEIEYLINRFNFFENNNLIIKDYNLINVDQIIEKVNKDSTLLSSGLWSMPKYLDNDDKNYLISIDYIGIFNRETELEVRDLVLYSKNQRQNHVFSAIYEPDFEVEFQFDLAFSYQEAEEYANIHSRYHGYLPFLLRHKTTRYMFFKTDIPYALAIEGTTTFGIDESNPYHKQSNFFGVLVHESAHVVFDQPRENNIYRDPWQVAVELDNYYLAYYAEDYPFTEDIAVTIDTYMYLKFKPYLLNPDFIDLIRRNIPNRLKILDSYDFNSVP
jgi:sulfur relay (sulfurtransferase) DsrF/TusC family protein